MNLRLKLSALALLTFCVACSSGGGETSDVASTPEPVETASLAEVPDSTQGTGKAPASFPAGLVEAAEALNKRPKQSYKRCLELCVQVMDQAGQVTDECPRECRADASRYTESDLMTDDEDSGLVAFDECLKPCLAAASGSRAKGECRQSCCVASCELRQEYKGSGMGAECPTMCRDFLERTSSD